MKRSLLSDTNTLSLYACRGKRIFEGRHRTLPGSEYLKRKAEAPWETCRIEGWGTWIPHMPHHSLVVGCGWIIAIIQRIKVISDTWPCSMMKNGWLALSAVLRVRHSSACWVPLTPLLLGTATAGAVTNWGWRSKVRPHTPWGLQPTTARL